MTQGLVTIMQGRNVRMKIVTGCDGMKAKRLSNAIVKLGRVPTLVEAYNLALKLGFGSPSSLVVVGANRSKFETGAQRLPPLYRKTFNRQGFNPRWKHGTADYIEVVRL
jgi:hypothetical protein